AAAVLFPPGFALLAPLAVEAYRLVRVPRIMLYRRLVSSASASLGYGAASIVFRATPAAIAGPSPRPGQHAVTWVLLAAGCYLVAWVIRNALVLAAIGLAMPEIGLRDGFGGRAGWASDLFELGLAVTIAAEVAVTGPVVLIFAVPVVVFGQRSLAHAQLAEQRRVDAQSGALTFVMWRDEAEV